MDRLDRTRVQELYDRPLPDLLDEAWALTRARFPLTVRFAAPSAKHYESDAFCNCSDQFVPISLTGRACELMCEHCKGRLLETMYPAASPSSLRNLADTLVERGCQGVLISGGADAEGRVPLSNYGEAIAALKARGLKVIVHSGLVDPDTAAMLKRAGADQVLIDMIGDADTIREVYHLHKTPADYAQSLYCLKDAGLAVAPHIVIGLHYGQVRGELEALRLISAANVEAIVLVVLTPLQGTPMCAYPPAPPDMVGKIAAIARILNPETPVSLGCARPAARKFAMERLAIHAGVNAIAYPSQDCIEYAQLMGLTTEFSELCCSLLWSPGHEATSSGQEGREVT
jgi:lipoyl synthase